MITHRYDGETVELSVSCSPADDNSGNNSDRFDFVLRSESQPFICGKHTQWTEISFSVVGSLELMELFAGFDALRKHVG